jgi:hypothetical protein
MTEAMREQFEAWARGVGYSLAKHRTEDDWYVSNETQAASDGYQAALSSPAVAGLVEALKLARTEMDGLPHSLGYDFTHIPKIDDALAQYATLAGEKA